MKKLLFMLSIAVLTAPAFAGYGKSKQQHKAKSVKSEAVVANKSPYDIDDVRIEVEVFGEDVQVNGSVHTGPLASGKERKIDLLSATRKEYGSRSVLDMFESPNAVEAIQVTQIQPQNCSQKSASKPCLGSLLEYGDKGIVKKQDQKKRTFVIMDVESAKKAKARNGKVAKEGILVEIQAR